MMGGDCGMGWGEVRLKTRVGGGGNLCLVWSSIKLLWDEWFGDKWLKWGGWCSGLASGVEWGKAGDLLGLGLSGDVVLWLWALLE